MPAKKLTLSIIIPVYNEEHHVAACLDSIATQTLKPDEVIVVDNNSTDKSMAIARRYSFVTIVKEPVQGRGYARTAGFNQATGDILGRINADSYLRPDWVERVLHDFGDASVAAVTGIGKTNVLPRIKRLRSTLWSRVYYWHVHAYFGAMTTWGANMAIRRDWWLKLRHKINKADTVVHEDIDISLLIAGAGGKIIQDNQLLIKTNGQNYHYWPKFYRYNLMKYHTRKHHSQIGTLRQSRARLLGYWQTFFGRLFSILLEIPFVFFSLLLYPVDFLVLHYSQKAETWLD